MHDSCATSGLILHPRVACTFSDIYYQHAGGPLPEEVLRTTAMRHAVRRGPERAPSLDLRAFTAAIMDLHALYNPLPGGGSLLSRVASLAQDAGPNHASQSTARDANSDAHLLSSQPSPNTSPRPSSSGSMDSGNSIPVVFPLKTLANNNKAPNGNLGAPSRSVQVCVWCACGGGGRERVEERKGERVHSQYHGSAHKTSMASDPPCRAASLTHH